MSSIIDQVKAVLASSSDKPPKHMRTMRQIQEDEELSRAQANKAVTTLVRAGKWHMKKYKVFLESCGDARPVPHYGPVKPVA